MRTELKALLESLETSHTLVERQINQRYMGFGFPSENTCKDHRQIKDILTRFYWCLFCPEIPIENNYTRHKEVVWTALINLVLHELGTTPESTMTDLAISGAEGGFRNLFETIARILTEQFQQTQAEARVNDYWSKTPDKVKILDAQDYIKTYQQLLPIDQVDAGAVRLISNFKQVLQAHPELMESKKVWNR